LFSLQEHHDLQAHHAYGSKAEGSEDTATIGLGHSASYSQGSVCTGHLDATAAKLTLPVGGGKQGKGKQRAT
jgi:hypothetical protein